MALAPGGAVVTGASRGIGAAVAIALARAGADVVISYCNDREAAERVVAAIRDAGRKAAAVQGDLGREEDVLALAEHAANELGEIGIFVSNAALPFTTTPFLELSWADCDRELRVVDRACFLLARAFLPGMFARRSGRLIAIGSTQVRQPVRNAYSYASAKSWLAGLMRVLALEAGPYGVTVNTVVPGFTATDRAAVLPQEMRERYAARTPLGRLGDAEDVASAVVYLAGEEAKYVTGTELVVDGGHLLS
jgi:3-oxoacyl-[acyl-carrier protein] reductase